MLKRFTVIFICLIATGLLADDFDEIIIKGKKMIQEGVDNNSEAKLLEARSLFERLLQNKEMQWLTEYYIGYVDYRIATMYMIQQNTEQQVKYLDDGIKGLNVSVEKNAEFADAYGLLSAMLGQKIGIDPSLGMTLGYEAASNLSDALELGGDNPRIALFSAYSEFYTPEQFGGSKTRAMKEIQRSTELYKTENLEDKRLPNWGHSEAWGFLGYIHLQTGELEGAKKSVKKALEINSKDGFAQYVQQQLAKKVSEK